MSRKLWKIAPCDKDFAAQLSERCEIDPFLALLLAARGITDDQDARAFLQAEFTPPDPFELADMEKAVERISTALDSFEKIAICGDYDADGVTATALLYLYLEGQGANVVCYIPDRQGEGYGISGEAIQKLANDGVSLIITVDNGIAAVEETVLAKQLGIDMVITDHHQPGAVLPEAVAVIDPHRSDCPSAFKDSAGVGVAFKLVCALEGDFDLVAEDFADLVAIGTLADVVSLTGENRALVQIGLQKLSNGARPGLEALKAAAGISDKPLRASGVAFTLAPRINAAGRVGSAMTALQLLLSDDADTAEQLAQEISQMNKERQEIETAISAEAIAQIESNPEYKHAAVLVAAGEGWHPGVIGIVAARLVSRYGKPAVVIARNGDTGKGSCRSIDGFSVYDALHAVKVHLTHFGGHPGAAGLSIETKNIPALRKALHAYCQTIEMPFPTVTLDCKLNPAYIQMPLLDALSALEPCGSGNPAPLFGLYGMTLRAVKPVGEGKHLRLTLSKGRTELCAMLFSVTMADFPYRIGDTVDLAVQIEKNTFRGEVKPSVHVREIRFADTDEENYLKSLRLYDKYRRGDALTDKERAFLTPSRAFLRGVYTFIKENSPWRFDTEVFCKRSGCPLHSAATVQVALDVLCELGLVAQDGDAFVCTTAKAELSASKILEALQQKGA